MAKHSKRLLEVRKKIVTSKLYPITEAIEVLQTFPRAKFVESVDVSVNLGVDVRKSDQVVRSSTNLPHGTGKQVRVAVFTQGANVDLARAAGADVVGLEDLAEQVKQGNINFDVAIATPDAMRVVGTLGKILGPRGLMPNPKVGTVTQDVAATVRDAKGGQVRYRTDKGGIIHCTIGKVTFQANALQENLHVLMAALRKAKPSTSKGVYFKKVTLSTTMGGGVPVDPNSLEV
jgi:large subunit ribosomal protein L1